MTSEGCNSQATAESAKGSEALQFFVMVYPRLRGFRPYFGMTSSGTRTPYGVDRAST